MTSAFKKRAAKRLNWMIPNAVSLWPMTIYHYTPSFLSLANLRNLGSMTKTSTHVLLTSRKHATGFLAKSFGECCGSAVLTAACYWPSSHWSPAQKFASLSAKFNHNHPPLVLDSFFFVVHRNWIDSYRRIDPGVTVGSCGFQSQSREVESPNKTAPGYSQQRKRTGKLIDSNWQHRQASAENQAHCSGQQWMKENKICQETMHRRLTHGLVK